MIPADRDVMIALIYTMARAWRDATSGVNCPRTTELGRRARSPQVGDIVAEWTHAGGKAAVTTDVMASTIGVLEAITLDDHQCKVYRIRCLDGRVMTWENADVVALWGQGLTFGPLSSHAAIVLGGFVQAAAPDESVLFVPNFRCMIIPLPDVESKP